MDSSTVPNPPGRHELASWEAELANYREASNARAVLEITLTLLPFVLLWLLLWLMLDAGYWLGLLLAVPAAGFLVRLFLIQHDCGHGSFFPSQRANDWVGRTIGVLTLTPYALWRHSHAYHHAHAGNLDRAGYGEIKTLTVRRYHALPWIHRIRYRLYRHPLVLFGLGPSYIFLLDHRLPIGHMRKGWMPWMSTMGTNAAATALIATMMWCVGVEAFLLIQLPITILAASAGVWLFYVQHQFESTYWAHAEDWSRHDAGMHGSSHYDLPGALRWITANIGNHHVHHMYSRIPCYRLPEVMRDFPQLHGMGRVTLRQSLRNVRLALWDEQAQRLVSFGEARTLAACREDIHDQEPAPSL